MTQTPPAPTTGSATAPATPSTPTPVIPSSDPLNGSVDALTAESQAQQLSSSSLSAYGSWPNPQAVFEAITTGSTPTIASVIQAGDPRFQAELAGAPAGSSSLSSPYPRVPSQISDPTANLWQWSPQQQQQAKSSLSQDQNASWRSMGTSPQLNFGWMQQQRTGSANSIKQWQQLLSQRGYYGSDSQGHPINYQVSGVWDQATEAAFQAFMIQYATPYAIFGQDATTKANATTFLNGLGFDAATLESSVGRSPDTLSKIAQGWMNAQGPNPDPQKSELQSYADAFGLTSLPDSYQAILHSSNDPLSAIRNTLSSIPLIGDIPLLGGAFHGATNLITGNFDLGHLTDDPRAVASDHIQSLMTQQDKLSQADVENLAPALQAVQNDAGYLGFMNGYDNARTTTLLTVWDTLKEGLNKGKWENPFDPMSSPRIEAQAADNNLAAGIFGKTFAQDNPGWASVFNIAINSLDDPTMYIPMLGESELYYRSLGMYGATKTASRLIGKDSRLQAFSDLNADTMRMQVNQGLFNSARTAYSQGTVHDGMLAQMFAINGTGGERDAQRLALAREAIQHPDAAQGWQLFKDGRPEKGVMGFGWAINSGRGVFNATANFKAVARAMSPGLFNRMRVVGGMTTQRDWDALADPAGTSSFLTNMATLVGMDQKTAAPLINAYVDSAISHPDNAVAAAQAVVDALAHHYEQENGVKMADLEKWSGQGVDHVVAYAPHPVTGEEMSWKLDTKGMDENTVRTAQAQLNQLQERFRLLQATGAKDEDLDVIRNQVQKLANPTPGLTTQMANAFTFPWDPADLVAYKNRGLRTSQSVIRRSGYDKAMAAWRHITVGRISTSMRMDIGDDILRPFTFLVGHNQFDTAFTYLTSSILKMFGLLVPGVRGKILNNLDGFLEQNPDAVRLLKQAQQVRSDTSTFSHEAIEPGKPGYTEALAHDIRWHWGRDPMAQAWLQAAPGDEYHALEQYLNDVVKSPPVASDTVKNALRKYQREKATDRVEALKNYRAAVGDVKADPEASINRSRVHAWLQGQHADLGNEYLSAAATRFDQMMSGYMHNPTLREMATKGSVNRKALDKLVRDNANTPHRLPVVFARQQNPYTQSTLLQVATKIPDKVFENITGPMIQSARAGGFMKMKGYYEAQLRKYYRLQPQYGTPAFEREIESEAASRASDWMINNTYQGTRSVAGSMLRNVFPFWGATANMDRFYLRQAMSSPYIGSAVLHAGEASSQASSPSATNTQPGLSGLQGFMAHLGFGAGEGLNWNPASMFFLTSDGIGSLVPGLGPLFAPLWSAAASNSNLAAILSDIVPGAAQQIDFATGQAKSPFPYLADLLGGGVMAATGSDPLSQIPVLGGILAPSQEQTNARLDQAIQAYERDTGQQVSPTNPNYQSIISGLQRQVGRDLLGQGVASFTVPGLSVSNVGAKQSGANLDTWRQATTDQQRDQTMLADLPGVTEQQWQDALAATPGAPSVTDLLQRAPKSDAVLMAYEDSRVSQSDRDAIANVFPWVTSSAQSKYQTTTLGPDVPDRPFDLPQWQIMRTNGDIRLLSPDEFVGQVANERDINTGWLEYDNLKNQEWSAMVQNGWTTSTPQYKIWNEAVFQPALQTIQQAHPQWWSRFASGGSTTAADLAGKTRKLRTLQTWEVLPQSSDYETGQTVLWRNALQLRDNAAGQIYALKLGGGSTAEQQMVMQAFQEQLQNLAAQDPNFAAQLGGFTFAQWEDIVNLEADEMQANQMAGYPAQLGYRGSA